MVASYGSAMRIHRVWHDEMERYLRTGRLDEGPCWCEDCIKEELKKQEKEPMEISFTTDTGETIVLKTVESGGPVQLSIVTKDAGTVSASLFDDERDRLAAALAMFEDRP